MENIQSVQQASQAPMPTPKLRKKNPKQKKNKNFLVRLFVQHPLLLPIGLSAAFLGSGVFALYSLGYVGRLEPEEPEIADAEVVKPISTSSNISSPMPLWMVITIALSCASGSLILFLLLNRSGQHQKVKNQINRYQARLAQRRQKTRSRFHNNHPVLQPQEKMPVVAISGKSKPVVTILPPEQGGFQNQGQQSLANMLDIRKSTPLSAILRKN
ncbi:MAG: hypothetical protein SAK29_41775 [Scytonema sp. PMC 1069.18]|nr:hypothetical protein [Scytonema sp. PMC 1069.18]MEC4886738.1 hypothetical protein [Scytonema sp. PMC 1070.18]